MGVSHAYFLAWLIYMILSGAGKVNRANPTLVFLSASNPAGLFSHK
jgi:hypothetical protein